jgi:uncharacterized protein YbjT (DUF2867 family)
VRILVTGATGYVGSRLVTRLIADSHQVLTATRDPGRLERMGWFDDVTPVILDASDAKSVNPASAMPTVPRPAMSPRLPRTRMCVASST